jgi:hypothetical protein
VERAHDRRALSVLSLLLGILILIVVVVIILRVL